MLSKLSLVKDKIWGKQRNFGLFVIEFTDAIDDLLFPNNCPTLI